LVMAAVIQVLVFLTVLGQAPLQKTIWALVLQAP